MLRKSDFGSSPLHLINQMHPELHPHIVESRPIKLHHANISPLALVNAPSANERRGM